MNINDLITENKALKEENAQLRMQVQILREELEMLKRLIFGKKSEKYNPLQDGQQKLDFEDLQPEKSEKQNNIEAGKDEDKQTITYTKTKNTEKKETQGHGRAIFPTHLPRVQEIIIPENLPAGAKKIGELITEILEHNPSSVYVKQIIRYKYALPKEEGIITAPMPSLPIPKGNAGPSLLAHVAVSKYVDHTPLYRQSQQFSRAGIEISDSTLSGWMMSLGTLLTPLYEKHCEIVLKNRYLQMDESPIPVLTKDKPGATHKGYLWAVNSPPDKQVLFLYNPSRSGDLPREILKDYNGSLQTDGYAAYEQFENKKDIALLACMAHARRKFFDARTNYPEVAERVLNLIGALYYIEQKAVEGNLNIQQRFTLRQEQAIPVLSELKQFLENQQPKCTPKSSIGQAIDYTLKLWPRLVRYTENGLFLIDNNFIENAIRPIALGRKNYLFAGSHQAAKVTAMFYSFFGTCKLQGINPLEWFKDVLTVVQDYKVNRLEELLPQNRKK